MRHRRGRRPIRRVVQDELPITGPRGTAIYPNLDPNIRTTAEFEDPKERFWSHMLDLQHYIRIVPTLTAPGVMCAGTAMKNIVIKM